MTTTLRGVRGWFGALAMALLAAAVLALPAGAAGPPFPDPVVDQAVYDTAGIFDEATIDRVEATIDAIESRTGAEVVVYSQVVDYGITTEEAERHAIALMDQWGVGRQGIDDGLVILFDMDPSLEHGQVQLYAGPGYRASYLTNEERQGIFENDMLPFLRRGDMDGALLAAMERIDAAATQEHAETLSRARILDALIGLIGAPVVFIGLVVWGVRGWARTGRDPELADSESILLPAPPPGMTPATAALVLDGTDSRRSLTTAMIDLAARGLISFREEKGFLGIGKSKVGIDLEGDVGTDVRDEYERQRASRQPLGPAERWAYSMLGGSAGEDRYLDPKEMLAYGQRVSGFGKKLEKHATSEGWFREEPSTARDRWLVRATFAIVGGVVALIAGANLPSGGIVLAGVAAIAGGVVLAILSMAMPARTKDGVYQLLMLRAYRRTLERTMAQARSMDQVVAEAKLDWLETPDRAVVWGVALGLASEVEEVLKRSIDDLRDGRLTSAYTPAWYSSSSSGGGGWGGGGGGGGLMSSSAIPNVGGMMAVLGTIGNTPSSSGSGGGGFGGGGSGGGGGGAGGGF